MMMKFITISQEILIDNIGTKELVYCFIIVMRENFLHLGKYLREESINTCLKLEILK
jgi:hypothetical protein